MNVFRTHKRPIALTVAAATGALLLATSTQPVAAAPTISVSTLNRATTSSYFTVEEFAKAVAGGFIIGAVVGAFGTPFTVGTALQGALDAALVYGVVVAGELAWDKMQQAYYYGTLEVLANDAYNALTAAAAAAADAVGGATDAVGGYVYDHCCHVFFGGSPFSAPNPSGVPLGGVAQMANRASNQITAAMPKPSTPTRVQTGVKTLRLTPALSSPMKDYSSTVLDKF